MCKGYFQVDRMPNTWLTMQPSTLFRKRLRLYLITLAINLKPYKIHFNTHGKYLFVNILIKNNFVN